MAESIESRLRRLRVLQNPQVSQQFLAQQAGPAAAFGAGFLAPAVDAANTQRSEIAFLRGLEADRLRRQADERATQQLAISQAAEARAQQGFAQEQATRPEDLAFLRQQRALQLSGLRSGQELQAAQAGRQRALTAEQLSLTQEAEAAEIQRELDRQRAIDLQTRAVQIGDIQRDISGVQRSELPEIGFSKAGIGRALLPFVPGVARSDGRDLSDAQIGDLLDDPGVDLTNLSSEEVAELQERATAEKTRIDDELQRLLQLMSATK